MDVNGIVSNIKSADRNMDAGLMLATWKLICRIKEEDDASFKMIFRELSKICGVGGAIQWSILSKDCSEPIFYRGGAKLTPFQINNGLIIPAFDDRSTGAMMHDTGYELVVSMKPEDIYDEFIVSSIFGRMVPSKNKNMAQLISKKVGIDTIERTMLCADPAVFSRIPPGNSFYVHSHLLNNASKHGRIQILEERSEKEIRENFKRFAKHNTNRYPDGDVYWNLKDVMKPVYDLPKMMEEHYSTYGMRPHFVICEAPYIKSKPEYYGIRNEPKNLEDIKESTSSDEAFSQILGLDCAGMKCILPLIRNPINMDI